MAIGKTQSDFWDYEGFVEKFKSKKTTDDCYTPENIYNVIADYVSETYGIRREDMVRPFWPGGDYERFNYPDGCCVVDNPPFSIIKQICRDYQNWHVRFFLFCPYLTAGGLTKVQGVTIIVAPCSIRYENGAEIPSGFVTNLEPENIIRGDPMLLERLDFINKKNLKAVKKQVPKYEYPDHVLTVAKVGWFTIHQTPYKLERNDCCIIAGMDAQLKVGKSIFGSGFLLNERAAAERAAAERWQLSDRERKIIAMMKRKEEK